MSFVIGDEVTWRGGAGRTRRVYRAIIAELEEKNAVVRRLLHRKPGVQRWELEPLQRLRVPLSILELWKRKEVAAS